MANIRYQFMTDFPYNIKIERIYVWDMDIEIIHLNVGREFVNLSGSPAMPGKKKMKVKAMARFGKVITIGTHPRH